MPGIHTIAVTTDFSGASRKAFPIAAALAASTGAQLVLLHVFDVSPQLPLGVIALSPADEEGLRNEVRTTLEARLAGLAEQHFASHPTVQTVVLEGRDAARAICDYAQAKPVDMIAIATGGHSGVSQMLMGDVATRVVRGAPCPVITVPVS